MARDTPTAEDKRAHLGMIQDAIARMGSNQFLFKGWSITLIMASTAFAITNKLPILMIIPIASTVLFWAIDAYYLMLERAFINLFNTVRKKPANVIDYSLTVNGDDKRFSIWLHTLMTRPVLWGFYGSILIVLVAVLFLINFVKIKMEVTYGA